MNRHTDKQINRQKKTERQRESLQYNTTTISYYKETTFMAKQLKLNACKKLTTYFIYKVSFYVQSYFVL